ncbi:MAG: hypothetical protein IT293_01725 [Deltaproteobacteria bacterium]|nr:hypothetical protein [Deltaproteobacteria bacterium]
MPKEYAEKTRPVHEVKVGFVKAVVWPNATKNGTRYSVTLTRLYKDGENWKSTASFNPRDLADVVRASVAAELWLREHTKAGEAAA